jgi:hypothetical protein
MKKFYFLLFTLLIGFVSQGQIYTEDFSTYTEGTGIDGSGNIGDYPAGVSQWTLDVSAATLSATSDWVKVTGERLSFRDVDGDAIWESQLIDISTATSDVTFSLDGDNNAGGFEPLDYFDVYYSVDGGAFTLISNWNGLGDAMHTILGEVGGTDWAGPTTITQGGISGSTLQLRVVVINNAGGEEIYLDNIVVSEGALPPSINITSPANGASLAPGTTNVDLEFSSANLNGTETVNITVNGVQTNDVTSPFPIMTANGQSYTVLVELVDGGLLDSDTINFSVESVSQVGTVAALRGGTQGQFYELTGEAFLTYQQGFRNQKFIQDATGGILIDDTAGNITTTYAIGDGITGIVGELNEFGGMMQFTPSQDPGAPSTPGGSVTPQSVSLLDLATNPENYESELVTVTNVTMDNSTPNFAGGSEHAMNQSGDMFNFRSTFFSADYADQNAAVPTVATDITGIVNERSGGLYFLTARDAADFSVPILSTDSFETSKFSLYPNPTNTGFVTITSTNSEVMNVKVFDILGKQVKNEILSNNTLNVSNLNTGVYIVKITQNNASITKKLVIR